MDLHVVRTHEYSVTGKKRVHRVVSGLRSVRVRNSPPRPPSSAHLYLLHRFHCFVRPRTVSPDVRFAVVAGVVLVVCVCVRDEADRDQRRDRRDEERTKGRRRVVDEVVVVLVAAVHVDVLCIDVAVGRSEAGAGRRRGWEGTCIESERSSKNIDAKCRRWTSVGEDTRLLWSW